jgi:hypothetical protein
MDSSLRAWTDGFWQACRATVGKSGADVKGAFGLAIAAVRRNSL